MQRCSSLPAAVCRLAAGLSPSPCSRRAAPGGEAAVRPRSTTVGAERNCKHFYSFSRHLGDSEARIFYHAHAFLLRLEFRISNTPRSTAGGADRVAWRCRLSPSLRCCMSPSLRCRLSPSLRCRLSPSLRCRLLPSLRCRLSPSLRCRLLPSLRCCLSDSLRCYMSDSSLAWRLDR